MSPESYEVVGSSLPRLQCFLQSVGYCSERAMVPFLHQIAHFWSLFTLSGYHFPPLIRSCCCLGSRVFANRHAA
uniref:Uncharacterized protein n=1 Tax=Physcomitrium patens TaxID=3218 RepID=A0A2K1KPP2_PHYPA|nr:hypothetical protein PHYPA_006646 [Physcomitrium patens]